MIATLLPLLLLVLVLLGDDISTRQPVEAVPDDGAVTPPVTSAATAAVTPETDPPLTDPIAEEGKQTGLLP